MIELNSLDAAREALLCAREDGMSMENVAAEGRYPYHHPEMLLEEIPEDLQQKFLSVHPGEILDPIAHGDGFHLCRVMGKKTGSGRPARQRTSRPTDSRSSFFGPDHAIHPVAYLLA